MGRRDELQKIVREALGKAREGMETWTAITAPTECSSEHVEVAQKRIREAGTLWYIATVTEQIDEARAALGEMGEKE